MGISKKDVLGGLLVTFLFLGILYVDNNKIAAVICLSVSVLIGKKINWK